MMNDLDHKEPLSDYLDFLSTGETVLSYLMPSFFLWFLFIVSLSGFILFSVKPMSIRLNQYERSA